MSSVTANSAAERPLPIPGGERSPEPAVEDQALGVPDVLVVDDSATVARLLETGLTDAGFNVRVATDGGQGLELALERVPDVVLADVMMPVLDGVQLTQKLRADPRTAATTIILVTAKGVSGDKLEGFEAGADDYVVKPFHFDELLARINGSLRRAKVLRAQSPLTRLPGNIPIQEEIETRVRRQADFAVLYADLDNFKAFNDKYGFLRGDRVIQMAARVLQDAAVEYGGPGTFVGHVGGDDFVIVTELGKEQDIAPAALARFDARILEAYDEDDRAQGFIETTSRQGELQRFPVMSLSIGVATTERRVYSHHAEVIAIASEMKSFSKLTPGSSWAADQRSN